MRHVAAIVMGLALLAGCSSARDRCTRDIEMELAQLDRQIALSQQALARGYREELRRPAVTLGVAVCTQPARNVGVCADTSRPPQRVAVPVDPAVEGRVLTSLQARRAEILNSRAQDIAQCAAG